MPDDALALSPLVSDDTFAVAYIDVTAFTPEMTASVLKSLYEFDTAVPLEEEQANEFAQKTREYLGKAGIRFVYVVAGIGDVHRHGGPLIYAPLQTDGDIETARSVMKTLIQVLSTFDRGHSVYAKLVRQMQAEPHDSGAMCVATPATQERYNAAAPQERPDLLNRVAESMAAGNGMGIVFSPGKDARRVLRELLPELPEPYTALTGRVLADELEYAEFNLNVSSGFSLSVAIKAKNRASAPVFARLMRMAPGLVENLLQQSIYSQELEPAIGAANELFQPVVEGSRIIGRFKADIQTESLGRVVERLMAPIREFGYPRRRLNQFKMLAIGMQNYHDCYTHLPASAAFRDKQGRPLLSWRVAILPFVEEDRLYKQFHLDEPWDSEHNRTLIEQMPAIYADPDQRHLSRQGKTTYQVPVGPETVFYKNEGTTLREITDGTSKTIMIVEVEPSRAVEWTKPEDWEVDMQDPRRGVERTDRRNFVAARCDCWIQAMPSDISPDELRALLTRAGRD